MKKNCWNSKSDTPKQRSHRPKATTSLEDQNFEQAAQGIKDSSLQLYVQALTTFELLNRVIGHVSTFYSQRRPQELGSFTWVVDGKEPAKVTRWEQWWAHFAQGALVSLAKKDPPPFYERGNYSFFDRYNDRRDEGNRSRSTDLKALFSDFRFSSEVDGGLELVDILTTAVRRALRKNLAIAGWKSIRRVMIHRSDTPYIKFLMFGAGEDEIHKAAYSDVVFEGFVKGGKPMITKRNEKLDAKKAAVSCR